ncbi:amino acid ABC transporter permease [Pseudooceanicola onchidii]|uniref:amino acid ABC transporter permease n=1 Tax=Pseudooceanicola onchidii TaxID=2562279 RepID=UPI0010AA2302|nr:amino acid ABC transporter permease [Pseudooceanicola onchidii]
MNGLDFSVVADALPYLWKGLQFSLTLTVVAFAAGLVLGVALALVQHLEVPVLSPLAKVYVAIMRSIPLIMVLFWFFFLVPLIIGAMMNSGRPVPIGGLWTAIITFSLFEAAYYSEIIRVGLRSVNKGQYEAAKALSLSTATTYRSIVLPQVFRITSPIILNQTIILFQDTSLVYVLSLTDLTGAASKIAQLNGTLVEMYLFIALVYLVICTSASQLVAVLRKRTRIATTR